MIRIVLVDDQELVRSGFAAIIDAQDDMGVVGEARDGASGLDVIRSEQPDVVLMDIRMPGMDGIAATHALVSEGCAARVIILTTFDLDDYVYQALSAGASGFLLKDMPRHRLIDAIRLVAGGDALVAPSLTRRLIEAYVRRPVQTDRLHRFEGISSREMDVLRLLAAGLSNGEIADRLFIAETTVKSHVAHILTKLNLRDRVQAVIAAYECRLVGPTADPTEAQGRDW